MKLLIPVTGLPVPAVRGGAVQTGIQQIIDENEKHGLMDITIISEYDEQAEEASRNFKNTKFVFIKKAPIQLIVMKIINKAMKILGFKKRFVKNRYFLKEFIKAADKLDYDFVLVKNRIELIVPLSKLEKNKLILQLHNDYLNNNNTYRAEDIVSSCELILVNSKYIKDRVLTISNSNPKKVLINLNCTDTKIFNKSLYLKDIDAIRSKYGIGKKDVVIMYSGRLIRQKGVAQLINAVKKLPNDLNFKLLIIGSKWYGRNSKDKYFKHLKEISSEIANKIIFTGYIPYNEMPKLHAISDIAVVPSLWEEPAGRVVIEAEASGLPVIVSDSGGISDYVCQESAIVVKRGSNFEEELSEALKKLIIDEDLRERMGTSGHIFAQKYNPENYYRELYDYLKMLN